MTTALISTNGHELTAQALDALAGLSAVSPEAALRRPLDELVGATLAAAGRTKTTRRSYATAIGQFLQYLDEAEGDKLPAYLASEWRPFAMTSKVANKQGRMVQTAWSFYPPAAVLRLVSPSTLDGYRAWLEQGGAAPDSATVRVYQARTFLAVAYREGVLTTEQAQRLGLKPYRQRQKRDQKPVGRRLTPAEVKRLRAAVDASTAKGKRDLAILDMMLYQGLRVSEVTSVDLESFTQDQGRWWLVIQGKGQKTRKLKLHDQTYKSVAAWLEAAGVGQIGEGSGPVFLGVNKGDNLTGQPLNSANAGRLVTEYGAAAGLAPARGSGRLAPHDLRRTMARNAYDNGAPLLLIQQMLGHADVKTTAHYIGAHDENGATATDFVKY